MPRKVLELIDVHKVYRAGTVETYALRGVNLEVFEGDFIAIMGPSGSGKSTLLNIAGLLDRPTRGKVLVNGLDATKLSDRELAHVRNRYIGFVFQQFNLVNRLTVLQNIEMPLVARGVPRSERRALAVRALLSVGGDTSWLFKKPLQLSGGQQQRVAIARAIVGDPKLILADEPTGSLDRKTAKTVVQLFRKLNEEGRTIVVVTHDPEVANCTKKINILRDGRIVDTLEPDPEKCIVNTVE
ncbi:MAG: ABC transporter ATP-binding protein [Thermoproteota archaeon]